MARHAQFTIASGIRVFFCDPHSPWQRPTNENGNGLIRDFFPKGTDFTTVTDQAIADMETLLNNRPRKVLNFAVPRQVVGRISSVSNVGMVGSARPRCTSSGRFQEIAS